ncbi:MAG: 3-dehydroquinate synthase [Myxococcales bacterium]|nr:3-dehydroquinate synthase [Myxococcales bacterium]
MPDPTDTSATAEGRYLQRFQVAYEYPVFFTRAVFDPANRVFVDAVAREEPDRRHRVQFVLDAGVVAAWPRLIADIEGYVGLHAAHLILAGPPLVVPGGEVVKNDRRALEEVLGAFAERRLDRHAFVAIVGGGSVQDMVGYAAATAHRGIRVVRVPTTVLAQADGGVGVKNGVNAFGGKNYLGTFAPPYAVIDDFAFLETLARRDRVAGLAEAVKVGLIRDAAFFRRMEAEADALARFDPDATARVVRRCAELHLEHIAGSGDPFERAAARPLDYGHWSAHRLELATRHRLNHGEAVAIGMALDARYAFETGLLAEPDVESIRGLLERLGLALWDDALLETDPGGRLAILAGLEEFREHLGGELTVTLLEGIGRPVNVHEMDPAAIARAVAWLRDRSGPQTRSAAARGR